MSADVRVGDRVLDAITAAAADRGLTLAQLYDKAGILPRVLKRDLADPGGIDLWKVEEIAAALEVDCFDLLTA